MSATLIIGGAWTLNKIKEYRPILSELKARENNFKRGAGFAFQDFYRKIKKPGQ
jgi:hypothetical protein